MDDLWYKVHIIFATISDSAQVLAYLLWIVPITLRYCRRNDRQTLKLTLSVPTQVGLLLA